MFKKILMTTLLLVTMLFAGCGDEDKPAETPAPEKKEVSADKAIVTYAELLATGESAGAGDLGLTDAEKDALANSAAKYAIEFAGNFIPLSDESGQAIAAKMHELAKANMKFTATLKKDDAEHPVVELKTNPFAVGATNEEVENDMQALVEMSTTLQDGGATPEQLKENADFQALAVKALTGASDASVFSTEKTFEVACEKVNGHWAPANVEDLYYFLTGVDVEAMHKLLEDPEGFAKEVIQDVEQQQ